MHLLLRVITNKSESDLTGSGTLLQPLRNRYPLFLQPVYQFSPHGGIDPASQQAFIPGLEVVQGIPVYRDDRDAYDNKCYHTLL